MFEQIPNFVGRKPESQRLEHFISKIRSGDHGLLVVEAPSGGGKSLFVQKHLTQISKNSFDLIFGQGVQMSAMTPGYILSGLSRYLLNSDQWTPQLREHIQYYFEDIARIFPGISLSHIGQDSGSNSETSLDFFALNRIAICLAKMLSMIATPEHPVLLILDDFQWSDELSKQTIKMWLETEQKSSPYFGIILCCRKENKDQLSYLRKDLIRDHIELNPFNIEEAAEYFKSNNLQISSKQIESIVNLTSGNPFAIKFLANDMQVQQNETSHPTATLNSTICKHFLGLASNQQKLLLYLAVFGKFAHLTELAELTQLSQEAVFRDLSEDRLAILIDVSNDIFPVVKFNHDKIREAILTLISESQLKQFHDVVARYLEKQVPRDLFKLAYHYSEAGDQEKALTYSMQAAEGAFAIASYDLAIQNFKMALSFMREQNQKRAEVLARLGESYLLIGRYDLSTNVFKEAIRCCDNTMFRSECTGKLGEIEFKQGHIATATDLIEKALLLLNTTIPRNKLVAIIFLLKEVIIQTFHTLFSAPTQLPKLEGRDALIARLLSRLAYCYWFGKGAIYCGWAHIKELNKVEKFADSLEKAQAYSEHAPVMTMIPWFERGINYSYQSMKIRENLNSRWGVGQSKGFLGTGLYGSARYQEAEQVCSEAFDTLVKEGDMWEANTAGWHVALAYYRQGRLKEAISQSQKILSRAKSFNDNQSAAISLGIIGKASHGKAVDIREIERIERLDLTDAHALAEISIAKALYLANQKKYDEALTTIEKAKEKVIEQGLRQEYVTPLWPWSSTLLRIKIEKSFLTPEQAKKSYRLLKKLNKQSLFKARFYKNNLPHALREEAYRLYYLGRQGTAVKYLLKSLNIAIEQKAQWEIVSTHELIKKWGKEDSIVQARDMVDTAHVEISELKEHRTPEKTVNYFLNEISQIKNSRDGLDKLYHFTSYLTSVSRSIGVVEYFWNSASHDFIPVQESQPRKTKNLMAQLEKAQLTRTEFSGKIDQEWITILPIASDATLFGFLYFVCTDEGSFSDLNDELPQIETLVRLVVSAIEQRIQSTQIQLLNQELALRVKSAITLSEQKNALLIEAEKQAQQASRAKSEFLANMSHEIRTPLNGVMGTISLLKNTPLANEQVAFLEALETSSDSLYRIVNDILDLTKIEAGRQTLQLESLWFSDLILQSCEMFQASASKKNLILQYDIQDLAHHKVSGDSLRIRQVLSNLINNAIKFTDSGSVTIKGTNTVFPDKVKYRVEVIDTGCGIAESDFKKLFKNFSQLDHSAAKKVGGTGLGLSICSKLIELMGGEIGLQSKLNEGSVFWFEITLDREDEIREKVKSARLGSQLMWDSLNVLVAEDNHVNQLIIRKILEGLNCQVDIVENGEKFIDKIKSKKYDLAFLDCQMPVVDGFEACRRLRADNFNSTPIIALTAYALESDRQKCFDSGMDDYLAKPVKQELIKSMMEKWYKKSF